MGNKTHELTFTQGSLDALRLQLFIGGCAYSWSGEDAMRIDHEEMIRLVRHHATASGERVRYKFVAIDADSMRIVRREGSASHKYAADIWDDYRSIVIGYCNLPLMTSAERDIAKEQKRLRWMNS